MTVVAAKLLAGTDSVGIVIADNSVADNAADIVVAGTDLADTADTVLEVDSSSPAPCSTMEVQMVEYSSSSSE